jgi:lipoprotein-releasing system ATP-binding protein
MTAEPHADPTTLAADAPPLVEARGLHKVYATGEGQQLEVLRGVSLDVRAGEFVAVVGESGTGKSTLLHLIGALDRPTEGEVLFRGASIFDRRDERLAEWRNRHVGFVFQFHHLLPEFTALENVAMPALIQGRSLGSVRGRARELLEGMGLGARLDHRPSQLSGGEQQRVAVARAFMNEPDLILMDEPTGNLDTATAEALHDEIARLNRLEGRTFVVVTHNPLLADRADRVLRIHAGRLQDQSPDAEPASSAQAAPMGGAEGLQG